jgi:uncharacterized protein YuzE
MATSLAPCGQISMRGLTPALICRAKQAPPISSAVAHNEGRPMTKKVTKVQQPRKINLNYDPEGDVLYINFGQPQPADDADITDEGVIIRLREGKIVGFTVLNAKEKLYESSDVLEAYAR